MWRTALRGLACIHDRTADEQETCHVFNLPDGESWDARMMTAWFDAIERRERQDRNGIFKAMASPTSDPFQYGQSARFVEVTEAMDR